MIYLVYSFLFSFSFFANSVLVDGVVAHVGNKTILDSELKKSMSDLGKNLFGSSFSLASLSSQEFNVFQLDVLNLLVGNRLVLLAAEEDTSLSITYDQINSFLDDNIQNIIDFDFDGSVLNFEKDIKTSVSEYKSKQWDEAKNILLTEEKKRILLQNISVTKEEIFSSFEFYKKENPYTPESFSFSLFETKVEPNKDLFDLKKSFLLSIKDSVDIGLLDFSTAIKKHSKNTPVSNALNGWWLRGELGGVFPTNKDLEKTLFSLLVGDISKPIVTRLGFHLFLIEDRAGEKIKLSQLFFPLEDLQIDLSPAIEKHKNILSFCVNDPGLFDSLVVENKENYLGVGENSFNGVFNNISFDQNLLNSNPFYVELSFLLKKLKNNSFSEPFVFKNSVFSTYLYNKEGEKKLTKEDLYLRWGFFESLAIQNKRNIYIEEWINKQKENFYVKLFIN